MHILSTLVRHAVASHYSCLWYVIISHTLRLWKAAENILYSNFHGCDNAERPDGQITSTTCWKVRLLMENWWCLPLLHTQALKLHLTSQQKSLPMCLSLRNPAQTQNSTDSQKLLSSPAGQVVSRSLLRSQFRLRLLPVGICLSVWVI